MATLLAGCLTLDADRAEAWNFDEHLAICRVAFKDACALVREQSVYTVPPLQKVERARRLKIACDSTSIGDAFGQACAVSGDLVSDPADLTSALGNAAATNDIHYYALALLNNVHFQPFSRREWQFRHEVAINAALDGSGDSGNESIRFERALFLEAFAEHFLEDSFSAGHLGFNRAASSAADAKLFHDEINDRGLWVSAPDKVRWFTLGDGHLGVAADDGKKLEHEIEALTPTSHHDAKCGHLDEATFREKYGSQIGRLRVECAATRSAQSMVYSFVTGKRHSELDYYAFRQIPDAKADRSSSQATGQATDLAASISDQATRKKDKSYTADQQKDLATTVASRLTTVNLTKNLPDGGDYTSLLYVRRAAHHGLDVGATGRVITWGRFGTFAMRTGLEVGYSVFRNTFLEPTYLQVATGVEVLWQTDGAKTGAFGTIHLRCDVHKSTNGFIRHEVTLGGGVSQVSYDRFWLSATYRARLEIGPVIVTPEVGPLLGWLDVNGNRVATWGGLAGLSIGGVWMRYGGEPL